MRTMCRLILGIAVFVAAASVVSAQQPDPQPPPSPVPEMQVTPAPLPPDIVPPAQETSETPVLRLIPIAPDLAAPVKPVKPVKKASASKKPIEKPATPESSSQAKEAVAAAGVTAADSSSPPPPGAAGTANAPAAAASPILSQKPPPAVDPVVQAEMDKKLADAAQSKKKVGGRILLGVGGLALIGLAVFFVRSRSGSNTLPPIFIGGLHPKAKVPVVVGAAVATVRSRPAR